MKREKEGNFSHSLIDDLIPTADNYCATFDFYDLILVLILSIFDFDSFVTEKFLIIRCLGFGEMNVFTLYLTMIELVSVSYEIFDFIENFIIFDSYVSYELEQRFFSSS